ncbi:MAG: glycosyltransferase [Pseudomonadota bacterium]|nr:glycosyltransferase [Pseudomonadota bacterium]
MRWGFVFQRPQHLMSRAARDRRVWFVEEPVLGAAAPRLHRTRTPEGVDLCVPHLPDGLSPEASAQAQAALLDQLVMVEGLDAPLAWLYTPMMLPLVSTVAPRAVVYDCMDELSAFRNAPPELLLRERALFSVASLVFTGGRSLYQAKCGSHPRVHLFPSSVDTAHFGKARAADIPEPAALRGLPHPRIGWVGVIDERMDLDLLAGMARRRPDWSFVMIGPIAKIDPASVPLAPNIHWLGSRDYPDLPAHLAHLDVGIMPFARNAATRFLSPTKTPEYLAAGLPVVSTPIRDVLQTYGQAGLASMAEGPDAFVAACEAALPTAQDPERLARVDAFLARTSWDRTWAEMDPLVRACTDLPRVASRSAR